MNERERIVVTGIVVVLLVAWLGFFVHRSPRFPGSLAGAAFGIAGAALMLVPLAYLLVKRVPWLRRRMTRRIPMRTLLAWHIYAGVFGPLLALVHTGHAFGSPLGTALTATMLIVVLSGWTGRYLLSFIAQERHEKSSMLVRLRMELETAGRELAPAGAAAVRAGSGVRARLASLAFSSGLLRRDPAARVLAIVQTMADVEFAIRTHEFFERWFRRWLGLHIVLSAGLYTLLGLHVWAEIYFGLRWLQ